MSNSRTSNSIKNIFANISYQLINLILSFVSRTVFIQVLGVGFLGITGLFNDVLSMLNLAELGFGTAMTYSMYKPLAENDYETLAGLTNFYKKVYRTIAASIAIIGLLLIPFLPYLVNLENDIPHVELYYVLFLASNIASYLVVYKTTVLYADQKNYILVKYNSYWKIAQTVVLTGILYLTHNYILFLLLQVLFIYGCNFHQSYVAQKYYPFINNKVNLPKEKTKGIFKDVGSAFLYKIANVLINATDNTLISVLISTEMVGYYSNYVIVVGKISGIIGTIFYSLIASLGNLIAKENYEHRFNVFKIMQTICSILSLFCVTCLLLLEDDFVRIWLGPEFNLGKLTLVAIVVNFYFAVTVIPVTTFREAAGLFRKTKFVMLWTAGLNIILSIILGKMIGLAGILFASSLSRILTLFWFEPMVLYRDFFNKSCIPYFLFHVKNWAITGISILSSYYLSCWFIPQNFFELIVKGIIVAVTSIVVIIIFYHKTEGAKLFLQRIKNMTNRG